MSVICSRNFPGHGIFISPSSPISPSLLIPISRYAKFVFKKQIRALRRPGQKGHFLAQQLQLHRLQSSVVGDCQPRFFSRQQDGDHLSAIGTKIASLSCIAGMFCCMIVAFSLFICVGRIRHWVDAQPDGPFYSRLKTVSI